MKTSVYIATSLDGFIAREDGSLDWLPGSDGQAEPTSGKEDYGYNAFFKSIDVVVMGRNTFELAHGFGKWPYANKRVIVLSKTLNKIPDDLPETVELRNCTPNELYDELERSDAKHVYVDGGKTIQGFLNAGRIKQLIITRIPILIGSGISLFGPLNHDIKLRHMETKAYANGFVQSRYQVLG